MTFKWLGMKNGFILKINWFSLSDIFPIDVVRLLLMHKIEQTQQNVLTSGVKYTTG